MSEDPLSFFAGDYSSSSGSEDEDSKGEVKEDASDDETPVDPDRLPSPSTLFSTVRKPSFLTNPSERQVDWDKFVKNDAEDGENIHLAEGAGRYSAIAPPTELDEDTKHNKTVRSSLSAAIVRTYSNTGGEISAPPVRYTTNEVDSKFRTVSNSVEGVGSGEGPQGSKRAGPDLEAEGETKKQKPEKPENFRQKEKRKRTLGQASRGTSYVEEEKRVLRQQFATDEVMN